MRPNESFIAQPVRSLQTMLRVIAEHDERFPSVIPDGYYGANTVSAVSAFQRRAGLPVTGVADQSTWDAIVPVYQFALVEIDEAQPIEVIFDPNQIIRRGQSHPNVYLAQSMLTVLSEAYGSIPAPLINGILDIPTSTSLSAFQSMSLLPVTGELDRHTWRQLALHYPMAANLVVDE